MSFNSQNKRISKLYLVENHANENRDFIENLGAKTGLEVTQFNGLKDVLGADAPGIIIADLKTIGDANAIATVKARFTAPLIILSDRPSMASAVTAMRAGACDFFPKPASVSAIAERINGLIAQYATPSNKRAGDRHEASLIAPFWEQERDIIETALDACNGNISRAAAALQISPSTIYRKKQSWDERLTSSR